MKRNDLIKSAYEMVTDREKIAQKRFQLAKDMEPFIKSIKELKTKPSNNSKQ